MFGFPASIAGKTTSPWWMRKEGGCLLLANGRSGVFLLSELLSPPKVWLPSYLCPTIADSVRQAGRCIAFFAVDYDLRIASADWVNDVGKGDLVVLIDYFGWPCDRGYVDLIKKRGAWVLEDACQALYSQGVGQGSDFLLFSPRKYLGVPDGAILIANRPGDILAGVGLSEPPRDWWMAAFSAMMLRREFDIYGQPNQWFDVYWDMKRDHPVGRYAMSQLSRFLLEGEFDHTAIAKQRVANYRVLAAYLSELAIFPDMPEAVVPLGFPIRMKNRDEVREALFKRQVYPPVHWPVKDTVPGDYRESHMLSRDIMTLPCDQRYGTTEMSRMISILEQLAKQ